MRNESGQAKDYRIFERFAARFPAKFKDTREDYGQIVYLRDASAQGAKLTCKERLYLNDHISLEVKLPDSHSSMVLRGEVVWTKNKESNMWDIGLKFHKVKLLHISRLYKFCVPENSL